MTAVGQYRKNGEAPLYICWRLKADPLRGFSGSDAIYQPSEDRFLIGKYP